MKTVLIIVAAFISFSASAQTSSGVSSDGRDFYVGFVYPSFNKNPAVQPGDFHSLFSGSALITTVYNTAKIGISFFRKDGTETTRKIYTINRSIQIPLNDTANPMQMSEPGDIPEYKACHITADVPVSVTYFSSGANSGGSYLALPTAGLGRQYVIPSYYDNPGNGGLSSQTEKAGGFFFIISAFDSTNVTIIPNGSTAGGHVGVHFGPGSNGKPVPYSVLLNRGECYWVKGDGADQDNDLSGSTVVSDKPVGVLAGHEDAFIGEGPTGLEGRDFMIEQVIPAECWDSSGYVSIPMVEAQPEDPTSNGWGQRYRMFTNYKLAKITEINNCTGQDNFYTSLYAYPSAETPGGVGCPIEMHSENGSKFGVMCYEQRNGKGTAEPFPAESMMGIVPMSRWKKSYMFYIPSNIFNILQDYYINVIGERNDIANNITFSHDGSPQSKLSALLPKGSYAIPGYPDLKGTRFTVHPGSYYLTNTRSKIDSNTTIDTLLQGAFMVYRYDMRALDPDFNLGDFDSDDFFFANANPAGMMLNSGNKSTFSVTVDSECGKWKVCAHSSAGIRSISLLNDSLGILYTPGAAFYNCHFDSSFDHGLGDAEFPGTNDSVCFEILVTNPAKAAYAAVLVTDNNGNQKLTELRFAPVQFSVIPESSNIVFNSLFPVDTCTTVFFINTGTVAHQVASVTLTGGNGLIRDSVLSPSSQLLPGDSLGVRICFSSKDTIRESALLKVTIDCLTFPVQISAISGTGIIDADDQRFGKVDTSASKCLPVIVQNIGSEPFTISGAQMSGSGAFTMQGNLSIPVVLIPGKNFTMQFCYNPTMTGFDTAIVHWQTNIPAPYSQSIKNYSILTGEGIAASLSVQKSPAQKGFSIRPNPATGNSIIVSFDQKEENAELVIYDVLAREMTRRNIFGQSAIEIPVRNLQNGIYYAKLLSSGSILTQKFEVLR